MLVKEFYNILLTEEPTVKIPHLQDYGPLKPYETRCHKFSSDVKLYKRNNRKKL